MDSPDRCAVTAAHLTILNVLVELGRTAECLRTELRRPQGPEPDTLHRLLDRLQTDLEHCRVG